LSSSLVERERRAKEKKKEGGDDDDDVIDDDRPRRDAPRANGRNKAPLADSGERERSSSSAVAASAAAAEDSELTQQQQQRDDSFEEGGDLVASLPASKTTKESSASRHSSNTSSESASLAATTDGGLLPSQVAHNLAQMGKLDRMLERSRKTSSTSSAATGKGHRGRRRPSLESESGKSVASRLSRLRRPGTLLKKQQKSSNASNNNNNNNNKGRSASSVAADDDSSPVLPSGSESSVDLHNHNNHHHQYHQYHHGSSSVSRRSLVSRISHFSGASPRTGNRRRLATADNDGTMSVASSLDVLTERTSHPVANDDNSGHVTLGIELAIRSGQVPRLCDERGRCLFHPHIRLQKPKLFGGWKVLFQHCPDCAVEHMKKTQEQLLVVQREKKEREALRKTKDREGKEQQTTKDQRRKKHRRSKSKSGKRDPIIGKDVGDEHFSNTEENKKSKKKRDRKKEKERLREELASSMAKLDAELDESVAEQEESNGEIDLKEEKGSGSDQNVPQEQQSQTQANELSQMKPPLPPPPPFGEASQDQEHVLVPDPKPKGKRVNGLPWSDYNGHSGRYTGEVNEQYLPHGTGEMVYDRGIVSTGVWYNGVLDTESDDGGRGSGRSHLRATTNEPPEVLPNYAIGDKGKDSDMIVASKRETAASVAQIRVHDAAWVRRSDGSWTYAVVKDRTFGDKGTIRFKVNLRGSTKAFPISQWGTYVRRIKIPLDAPPAIAAGSGRSLSNFLDNQHTSVRMSGARSVAGGIRLDSGGASVISVGSAQSAPMINKSSRQNLTTGKMKIRTRSRSRSRNRKNVTTLPLLFSSSMSVSEENDEEHDTDDWETASGSGYRLRGIDP